MSGAVEVRERPILYTADLVRVLLAGRKTQTRRPVNPRLYIELTRSEDPGSEPMRAVYQSDDEFGAMAMKYAACPYGRPGERLWVQEGYVVERCDVVRDGQHRLIGRYLADGARFDVALAPREVTLWRARKHPFRPSPGRFMYRSLARIIHELTDVRVERLREISHMDRMAEGVPIVGSDHMAPGYVSGVKFRALWDQTYSAAGRGWDANPWVWALSFRVVEPA